MYYQINEALAKQSKSMWSFSDYIPNSETNSYKHCVDKAYRLCREVPIEYNEKALYYADTYAKKLADNINKGFSIELRCPSVMIAGGSNFPNGKKAKQNDARDKNMREKIAIDGYLEKIEDLKYYVPRNEIKRESTAETFDNDYFKVVQNEEENRIQLFFEGKPADSVRTILKGNGWHWSGKNGCWQRQLTGNARNSVRWVIKKIKEGEKL